MPHVLSGVSETEFLTYKGTYGDKISGKVATEAGSVSATLRGQGSSKLHSCFGKLKKEELDVKKLLRDSSDRFLSSFYTAGDLIRDEMNSL